MSGGRKGPATSSLPHSHRPPPAPQPRCNLPATGGCPRVFRFGGQGRGGSSAVSPTSHQKAEERRLRPPGGGSGEAFPPRWGRRAGGRSARRVARAPWGSKEVGPAAAAFPEGLGRERGLSAPRGTGERGACGQVTREGQGVGRGAQALKEARREGARGAAPGDTGRKGCRCPQGDRQDTRGAAPGKEGRGAGAWSREAGGEIGNPGERALGALASRKGQTPRSGRPRGAREAAGRERAGGAGRPAVWGPGTGDPRGRRAAPPRGRRGVPAPALPWGPRAGAPRPHQMKSVQWLQKVGCLKKRAVNLWFFTSCTFFCRRAPLRAKRTVLSSPSPGGGPAAGSAILRAGSGSPRRAGPGPGAAGCGLRPGGAGGGGRARRAAPVTRPAAAARPAALGTAGLSRGGGRRGPGRTRPLICIAPRPRPAPPAALHIGAPPLPASQGSALRRSAAARATQPALGRPEPRPRTRPRPRVTLRR